jgi:hypothetical protein
MEENKEKQRNIAKVEDETKKVERENKKLNKQQKTLKQQFERMEKDTQVDPLELVIINIDYGLCQI